MAAEPLSDEEIAHFVAIGYGPLSDAEMDVWRRKLRGRASDAAKVEASFMAHVGENQNEPGEFPGRPTGRLIVTIEERDRRLAAAEEFVRAVVALARWHVFDEQNNFGHIYPDVRQRVLELGRIARGLLAEYDDASRTTGNADDAR